MTGNSNFKYYVLVNVDGKVLNVRASNGTYSYALKAANAKNDLKIENIEVEDNNDETLDSDISSTLCLGEEDSYNHIVKFINRQNSNSVTVGDEVAIGSEHFLVLSTNSSKTELFAKYNLLVGDIFDRDENAIPQYTLVKSLSPSDSGYGLQSNTAKGSVGGTIQYIVGVVGFSGTNYWNNDVGSGNTYTGNYCENSNGTGCVDVYNSSLSTVAPSYSYSSGYGVPQNNGYGIAYYVEGYVDRLKTISGNSNITGRLIKLEEAYSILQQTGTPLKNNLYNTTFWLGTAFDSLGIWYVSSTGFFSKYNYYFDTARGVRPVIIVNTSDL